VVASCLVASLPGVGSVAGGPDPLSAQTPEQRYTDWVRPGFRPQEYEFRRNRILDGLRATGGGLLLVPSSDGITHGETFRQLEDFWYLTGLEVPQSMLVLDAARDISILFMPQRDPRFENPGRPNDFPGRRLLDDYQIRGIGGADDYRDIAELDGFLRERAGRGEVLRMNAGAPGDVPDPVVPLVGSLDPTASLIRRLRDDHPEAELENAFEIVARLRMVKSEEEIKRIRKAARVGELAMQAAFDVAQEGVRWGALWDAIEQTYEQEGAEHAFIHLGFGPKARQDGAEWEYEYVQSGCHLPNETGIARDKLLWRGDVGRIDLGCFVEKPYHCDLARVAVVGEATDEMKRVYAAMVESYRRIAAAIKPGVEAAQLFHIGYRPLADAGLHPTVVLLGHGLGVDTHEPPWLLPTDHTPLQAGMVLTIEVVVYTDQLWSMNLEDMVLVTEEGCEFLTTWGHIDGLPQMVVMS